MSTEYQVEDVQCLNENDLSKEKLGLLYNSPGFNELFSWMKIKMRASMGRLRKRNITDQDAGFYKGRMDLIDEAVRLVKNAHKYLEREAYEANNKKQK